MWLLHRFGTECNLGNIAPADVLSLETLRLGLRSDTVERFALGERRIDRQQSTGAADAAGCAGERRLPSDPLARSCSRCSCSRASRPSL